MFSIPVIGITMHGRNAMGNFCLQGAYVDAIRAAGGIPLLLPPGELNPRLVLGKLDGLILSGGGDIEPRIYNGDVHPEVYAVDPERDRFELEIARLALSQNLPILGICRGLQVLNVVSGGDLISHLPDLYIEVAHRVEEERTKHTFHMVEILKDSRLAKAMAVSIGNVTSWHHQAVRNVSDSWQVVARASDGVIEAIEHRTHPWAVAVQWHPELAAADPSQQGLFKALVEAAHRYS